MVEGTGDHGCEYMTGGRVVVLGPTGRNFAAGMSGGIAWVLDRDGSFERNCNREMVQLERLEEEEEIRLVERMIRNHCRYTNSVLGWRILANWEKMVPLFVRVMPVDYKRALYWIEESRKKGLDEEEALMEAFQRNKEEKARAAGV